MKRSGLEVWYPNLHIPTTLLDAINDYNDPLEEGEIETDKICGVPVVVSGIKCHWHTDKNIAKYSALLVLRNDKNSFVQTDRIRNLKEQPVGTLILLNIRQMHRLRENPYADPKGRFWIAACIDYHDDRPTYEECLLDMKNLLKKPADF